MFKALIRPVRVPKIYGAHRMAPVSLGIKFGVRFNSSQTIDQLNQAVNSIMTSSNLDQPQVIQMLKVCQSFQLKIYEYEKFWDNPINKQINQKINDILLDERVQLNKDLLREIFKLKLPVLTNINIIRLYYTQNPDAVIDKPTALIPFRDSLFHGDLKNALTITDLTVGHPNYIKGKHQEFRSGIIKLIGSSVGISVFSKYGVQELIDSGFVSDGWRYLSSINSLLITYLINSSFLLTIVRFGRQAIASGGDYLTWQKGTFYSHWFKHADEMLFCSKIVEADIKLNGGGISGGEVSRDLVEELCRKDQYNETSLRPGYTADGKKIRLLDVKDNLEDLKLQAYWMSGGDGFEWVEPEQDPAELIWKQHLQKFDRINEGSNNKSLKWAENLIEEK